MKKRKIHIKWGNILLLIIMIISVTLFVISLKEIVKWFIDSRNTKQEETSINESINVKEIAGGENVNPPENKEDPYWDYIKMNLIDVDFTELKKKNSDTKGWLQVKGTNINYPFVQTSDNDYYLTHSFNKKYNDAGWVFMDYRNNASSFDKNTILYAHGRLDGTMFSSLKNILKSSWYDNKDNHIIRLSTETENTLWQVFSVYRIPTTSDYIAVNFRSDAEYLNLLNTLKERSNFEFNTTLNENDKILTLSTCYNDEDKVVMHAKLIKQSKR